MSQKLSLVPGRRYRVRGKGPIVSPPLVWDADAMTFRGARASYGVDVVRFVQPVADMSPLWYPIDDCVMAQRNADVYQGGRYGVLTTKVRALMADGVQRTTREVADALGVHYSRVACIMQRLEHYGEFGSESGGGPRKVFVQRVTQAAA